MFRASRAFILISTKTKEAQRQGIPIKGWDLVFYLTFSLVLTSFVQIAGALLVFSFPIVPAVGAILFSNQFSRWK